MPQIYMHTRNKLKHDLEFLDLGIIIHDGSIYKAYKFYIKRRNLNCLLLA